MVIVSGFLRVAAADRDAYLAGCREVVEQARSAPGGLDFAISADLVDPERINIFERWASQADVERFRGDGASDDQAAAIIGAEVSEFDVTGERSLS